MARKADHGLPNLSPRRTGYADGECAAALLVPGTEIVGARARRRTGAFSPPRRTTHRLPRHTGSHCITDHRCPYRCTSLFFGCNEENGIRCVYHGWKYDYLGNCVDQPNLPPHRQFKSRCTPRPIARPNATASLMSIWETPRGYRRCPTSPHYIFPKARPISASSSGTATGSRVSRAISTPLT